MIIQIYEIQTPHEAEGLIEAGVDHIGSVLTPEGSFFWILWLICRIISKKDSLKYS